MMLNQHELRAVVKRHCGRRMEAGEEPCKSCQKKLGIARSIDRQIDDMWYKYHRGYYNRDMKPGKRREYKDNRDK